MAWRQPSVRALADAIVASFHKRAHATTGELARFSPAEWRKTWFWLDASGLALYFLRHAEQAAFLDAVDPATLNRLRSKQHANCERTASLFHEFAAINHAFLQKRLIYANLKGFTLAPDSCPSPEMRLQLDLDFLVSTQHLRSCRAVLEDRGYELFAMTTSSWEFKAGQRPPTTDLDPYSAHPCHSIELHFNIDGMRRGPSCSDERLDRLSVWHYRGHSFPALSPHDQIIEQALHIFAHLRSAHIRPAWLLEFQRHVSLYKNDPRFWLEVSDLARSNPIIPIAFRVAMLITRDLFGPFEPSFIRDWAEHSVSPDVLLWLQRFGRSAVMADFPGTKLYLLLERELPVYCRLPDANREPRLFPAFRFPQILGPRPPDTFHARLSAWWIGILYALFRLRFHVVEGIRVKLAATAWKGQDSAGQRSVGENLRAFSTR